MMNQKMGQHTTSETHDSGIPSITPSPPRVSTSLRHSRTCSLFFASACSTITKMQSSMRSLWSKHLWYMFHAFFKSLVRHRRNVKYLVCQSDRRYNYADESLLER